MEAQADPPRWATLPALTQIAGLVHGFERRAPRPREDRAASRRRVASALAPLGPILFLQQVHGETVQRAPWEGTPKGDAAILERPGFILGIETADCLPVLLVDTRRRVAAAVHAGWRGTSLGVVLNALRTLIGDGTAPADVVGAMGPGIGSCCYEVGDEISDRFPSHETIFHRGPNGRLYLDLRAANSEQLGKAGVPESQIHHLRECTFCRADLYHSYRRDGPGAGRMVSYVGWKR